MEVKTPIGSITVLFADNKVAEVLLPGASISNAEFSDSSPIAKDVKKAFENYFAAQTPNQASKAWKNLVKVSGISSENKNFTDRIYSSLTRKVYSGSVVSYSELALLAGSPRASRAVGTAMRRNLLPIIVPCHRVLRSDGSLGGYMGTSTEGLKIKTWLLQHEGAL